MPIRSATSERRRIDALIDRTASIEIPRTCARRPRRSAHGRFSRALRQRNLFAAGMALREMRDPSLLVLLDYLVLFVREQKPAKARLAAIPGTAASSLRHER